MILRMHSTYFYFFSILIWTISYDHVFVRADAILSTSPPPSSSSLHLNDDGNNSNHDRQTEGTTTSFKIRRALMEQGPPGDAGSVFTPRERSVVDISVWEGQTTPMKLQLDPQIFIVPYSTSGDIIASEGPITYYAKALDSTTAATAATTSTTTTALPSWLKFNPESLEFTGAPPSGTYSRTTYLTVIVSASSVPGFIQATDRFTIQINVHTLGLATSSIGACSSSSSFSSGSNSNISNSNNRQNYLPDIVIDPRDRTFRFPFTSALFRIDGCTAPLMSNNESNILNRNGSNASSSSNISTQTTSASTGIVPSLTRLNVSMSAESARDLAMVNTNLPNWFSFDASTWTLSGTAPLPPIILPPRVVLDVQAMDNFNTTQVFKLQIFTNLTDVPPFTFQETVSDFWTKTGQHFDMDLDLERLMLGAQPSSTLAPASAARAVAAMQSLHAPVESQFWFEFVNVSDHGEHLNPRMDQNKTTLTRLVANHSALAEYSINESLSACSVDQLWSQTKKNNSEGDTALFPTWFNHSPSSTTATDSSNGLKVRLSGLVPCGVILRVRWIVINSLGQWTSTEFLILASGSGPPPFLPARPRKDGTEGETDKTSPPLGIRIAIGFALGIPVALLLWFLIRKYCGPEPKIQHYSDSKKTATLTEDPRDRTSRGGSIVVGLDFGPVGHHRQHTSEVVIHPDSEYRSSYEDDPSVGHRDSYSEKYVAENSRTHSSSEEGEGGGSSSSNSRRMSILGWIFTKEERAVIASAATSQTLHPDSYRRQTMMTRDPTLFNLKRLSMGHPFESNRFGFVNGNRFSQYDTGASTTGASTTGAGVGSEGESLPQENNSYNNAPLTDQQSPSTVIDLTEDSSAAATAGGASAGGMASTGPLETPPPMRPAKNPSRSLIKSFDKRGTKPQQPQQQQQQHQPYSRKQLRATASAIDLADIHLGSIGPIPSLHSLRPCHSFASSGTGYMASMSAGNTSIEDEDYLEEGEQLSDVYDQEHDEFNHRVETRQRPQWHHQQSQQQQDGGGGGGGEKDEEEAKNRRRLSRSRLQGTDDIQDPDHTTRISWTPNQFPVTTDDLSNVALSDEDNNSNQGGINDEDAKLEWIPRSDSGALMLGSNNSPASNDYRHLRVPSGASTNSSTSSAPPLSSHRTLASSFPWRSLRPTSMPGPLKGSSSKEAIKGKGTVSSCSSVVTAPVTSQEKAHLEGRRQHQQKQQQQQQQRHQQQLSVQTVNVAHLPQRRSVVEMIQSKETPVSPLTALSASLPLHHDDHENNMLPVTQDDNNCNNNNEDNDKVVEVMSVQCNRPLRSISGSNISNTNRINRQEIQSSNMSDDDNNSEDEDGNEVKDTDPRHYSLQSELGIIEHALTPVAGETPPLPRPTARPLSAPMLQSYQYPFQQQHSTSTNPLSLTAGHQSRVHTLAAAATVGRLSIDRARPISYPALVSVPSSSATASVPLSFVKATIGTAFHHTAMRNGSSSSPFTSPRSSMHIRGNSGGSPLLQTPPGVAATGTIGSPWSPSTVGEYRAYLVADPNDLALTSRHRPSSSLSSIDISHGGQDQDQQDRPKRKLPDWIQFNNRMRSLWGRPAPGSAGEWHVSLVQSRMVDVPSGTASSSAAPPLTALPTPPQPTFSPLTPMAGPKSVIHHNLPLFQSPQSTSQTMQEEKEVQVELVMLLVREPGEVPPKTPPFGASRWRASPIGGPSSRLSLDMLSARPSLDLDSCVTALAAADPRRTLDQQLLTTFLVSDKTGSIVLIIWGEEGQLLRTGDILRLQGGEAKLFRGRIQLSTSKHGKYKRIGEDTMPFAEQPNWSEFDWTPDPKMPNAMVPVHPNTGHPVVVPGGSGGYQQMPAGPNMQPMQQQQQPQQQQQQMQPQQQQQRNMQGSNQPAINPQFRGNHGPNHAHNNSSNNGHPMNGNGPNGNPHHNNTSNKGGFGHQGAAGGPGGLGGSAGPMGPMQGGGPNQHGNGNGINNTNNMPGQGGSGGHRQHHVHFSQGPGAGNTANNNNNTNGPQSNGGSGGNGGHAGPSGPSMRSKKSKQHKDLDAPDAYPSPRTGLAQSEDLFARDMRNLSQGGSNGGGGGGVGLGVFGGPHGGGGGHQRKKTKIEDL
ncbi:hypothetical protein BGZ83_011066 [Gryganskiella cystojenkinii]|nr:hypothetical protein BGZ83_011066 [Gryganskiella cystojenkinii]